MIISHKHRFIFFAVPKTGTQAIRSVLKKHLGDDDWVQENLMETRRLPIKELASLKNGHIKARELQPHLSEIVWNNYFKFGMVRNPWDRFVSLCSFMARKTGDFQKQPEMVMKNALFNKKYRKSVLYQPQSEFLCNSSGELILDYTGRYESIQENFDYFCEQVGLPKEVLPKLNQSDHGDYKSYYNDIFRQAVRDLYSEDVQRFNYEYDANVS